MATGNAGQRLPFTLTIMDSHDPPRPARVDGVPVYASSDETILRVEDLAADGMSGFAFLVAKSDNTARVTVTVDADLGAGIETKTGVSEDVTVTDDPANAANTFSFAFGPAEDPAPPAPTP